MDESSLKCNFPRCKNAITNTAFVTRCSHIFCRNHRIVGEGVEKRCPACSAILSGSYDLITTNVNPTEESISTVLVGYSPDIIFDIMSRALHFWEFQMNMQIMNQKTRADHMRTRLANKVTEFETLELNIKHYIQAQEKKVSYLKGEVETLTNALKEIGDQLNEKNRQLYHLQSRYEGLRCQNVAKMITQDMEPVDIEPRIFREQRLFINREPAPPTPSFVFRPHTPLSTPCPSTPRNRPNTNWQ